MVCCRPPAPRAGNVQPTYPTPEPQPSSQDNNGYAGLWSSSPGSDYCLRNQLRNYSFGTAPRLSNSPSTQTSTNHDETDSEEYMSRADITPRPSVVAYTYQPVARTPPWPGLVLSDDPRRPQTDTHNVRRSFLKSPDHSTPSSASASVTSFNDSVYAG